MDNRGQCPQAEGVLCMKRHPVKKKVTTVRNAIGFAILNWVLEKYEIN